MKFRETQKPCRTRVKFIELTCRCIKAINFRTAFREVENFAGNLFEQ